MVLYGWTEMKATFSELLSEYKASREGGRKRKREEEEGPVPLFGIEPSRDDAFQHIFDLSRVKGVRNGAWRLVAFRTDGIKCTLTFASHKGAYPPFHGAPELLEPGYGAIPQPSERVDVCREKRGLYRVNEKRNDLAFLPAEQRSNIELCVVDPGFCRVVQCGILPASTDATPLSVASAIANDGGRWHLTQDEWMASSGRLRLYEAEAGRRRECPVYEDAITALSQTRKRTANPATFRAYCRVLVERYRTLWGELTHVDRSHLRWQADKALQRFMARVANRMFRSESRRLHRHDTHPDERAKLRASLRTASEGGGKTVVFFGDGAFGATRKGKQSIPKKKLLKVLAATGVTVLLGEYNTSKMCPCGMDALYTPRCTNGLRVRVHKTTGDKCSVLDVVDNRDEVATVQFGCAALRCLQGQCWPEHLCRPCAS